MRGKRPWLRRDRRGDRIIPAHAGQTATRIMLVGLFADHPRACGANSERTMGTTHIIGSSPRMRGKREKHMAVRQELRIIPAHAGQTTSNCAIWKTPADHPRACGANRALILKFLSLIGSSPRMRGKQSDSISKTHSDNTRKIRFAQSVTFR